MDRRSAEEAIHQVESEYDRAWGEGDIDALVECLTEDALVMSPRGDVARGRAEIRTLVSAFLAGEARQSHHESSLIRIEFVTANVAVVDGEAQITVRPPNGDASASIIRHGFTDVLVERRRQWRIAHVRAYPLPQR